jgi:hypothetical protein
MKEQRYHFTNVQTWKNVTQSFPCFWFNFLLVSTDMCARALYFSPRLSESYHSMPPPKKTSYFFHPFLWADLVVHYMTQNLLPFTFLNSNFFLSSVHPRFSFFCENVLQCEKDVFFKKILLLLSAMSFSTSCCSVSLEGETNLQYSQVLEAEFSFDGMVRFEALRGDILVTKSFLIFSRNKK